MKHIKPEADLLAVIEDLQTRISFQEESIAALDQVIARQDQEILTLKAALIALSDRVKDLQYQAGGGAEEGDERPPHY